MLRIMGFSVLAFLIGRVLPELVFRALEAMPQEGVF